jgi:GIY-YIG catalytic domain
LDINVSLEENNILALSSILVLIPVLTLTPVLGLTPILGLTFASSYSDPESEKASILRENRGKSGIYMWKNKVNGKTYVGSSVDLTKRLRNYFNTSYLSDFKHIMLIYKALLAHGLFLQTSG